MRVSAIVRAATALAVVFAVSACDSAEERADEHFESAKSLLEAGDLDRAMVEFRNVFSLNENHIEARALYAKTARDRGNLSEAYANYLYVAERQPDDLDARLALAEMALRAQNWDEVERHGIVLAQAEVQPDGTDVVDLALRFRQAVLDEDLSAVRELTREANELARARPENLTLKRLIIDGSLATGDTERAAEVVDEALEITPDDRRLFDVKLRLAAMREDLDEIETILGQINERFPEDERARGDYIRFLLSQGRGEEAANFLREEIAGAEGDDKIARHIALVDFLRRTDGADAALAELETAIEQYENDRILRGLKAGILYDIGRREEGVSLMQAVVDDGEPSEETDRLSVALARMLLAEGNEVGARQLVERVLEHDPANVEALKMSAAWLIESDKTDEAIAALRTALDQSPQDAAAMTLMAQAHLRAGDPDLAQDLLALAVEASNNGVEESLRLAALLIEKESWRPAEDVLIAALRRTPNDIRLLTALGNVYVRSEDFSRARQVEETLRRNEAPAAERAANDLNLRLIARQQGRDQAIAFLEGLAEEGDNAIEPRLVILRSRIAEGETEEALQLAEELAAEIGGPRGDFLLGNAYLALAQLEKARDVFAALTESAPGAEASWLQLSRVQSALGEAAAARSTIDDGLSRNPDAPNLLWAKASYLERDLDIDGAIAIYEQLYERNSRSLVIANNLASLLSTYRTDEASLERAWTVARRLRGTEVPPFQDTYGWLAFLRGNVEEAITYLEPAAEALAQDPIVQYHLGRAYEEAGRTDEARAAYARAVAVAGDDPRLQIAEARTRLEALGGPPEEADAGENAESPDQGGDDAAGDAANTATDGQ